MEQEVEQEMEQEVEQEMEQEVEQELDQEVEQMTAPDQVVCLLDRVFECITKHSQLLLDDHHVQHCVAISVLGHVHCYYSSSQTSQQSIFTNFKVFRVVKIGGIFGGY